MWLQVRKVVHAHAKEQLTKEHVMMKNYLFPTFARLAGGGAEVNDGTADWGTDFVSGVWPEDVGVICKKKDEENGKRTM